MAASKRTALRSSQCVFNKRTFSTDKSDDTFFKVSNIDDKSDFASTLGKKVVGSVIDNAIDLRKVRPGEVIEVPYEMTIAPAFRDFWQSAFYSHDRINTSTPFARSLGLQDQAVPFSLMLFLAASMSHADHAKIQTGFSNAKYHWPAFAGDTFRKRFVIKALRNTSDGNYSVIDIQSEITNQRGRVVFSCEKSMMFPFSVPASDVEAEVATNAENTDFLDHLVKRLETLQDLGSQTLASLRPGQLLLHTLTRPLNETHAMQLATLGRLTHERHFNKRLYREDELVLPGGLVLALVTSLASRDLHEVLYEELNGCVFPNETCPGETIGAMTFIISREEHRSGDMEAVELRTIGVKNMDVHRQLAEKELPLELFKGPLLKPKALEELLKKEFPDLAKKIVCIADRKVYRQAPKQVPFLL
jgi:citrate lyase subunit beta/citryl-CoA lyase